MTDTIYIISIVNKINNLKATLYFTGRDLIYLREMQCVKTYRCLLFNHGLHILSLPFFFEFNLRLKT